VAGKDALLLPRLPGHSLRELLQGSPGVARESGLALKLAVLELARLHGCWTPHPGDGRVHPFSHADATVRNVLVDREREQAAWIDFETVHSHSLPAPVRQADDLLTLLCSAAAVIEPPELPCLCQTLLGSYGSSLVGNTMLDLMQSWDACPVARRLAIPDLDDHQWRSLCEAASRPR
jgi:hypothetical protein